MAAPKKKSAGKKGARGAGYRIFKYPQHVVAMTYFVFMLSMIFLYMVIVRYSVF